MSNISGIISSYDELMNKIDVSQRFKELLPQYDMMLGFVGEGEEIASTKMEWWIDNILPTATTITEDYTAVSDSTITVANVSGIRIGSILRLGTAILRVTAVNTSTKVLTVVKIVAGADATDGDAVEFISVAVVEGTDYKDSDSIQKEKVYNMTQIFEDFISFTKTQLNVEQAVQVDVFVTEVKKKLDRLAKQLNKTMWSGVRVAPSDNTTPRLMGGIKYLVSAHGGYKPSAAAFSTDNFDEFVRVSKSQYGNEANEIWMNSTTYKKFTALDNTLVRLENLDEVRSGRRVQTYITKYGEVLTIRRDEDILANEIYLMNASDVSLRPLRNDRMSVDICEDKPRLKKWHISGQYTLEIPEINRICLFTCS